MKFTAMKLEIGSFCYEEGSETPRVRLSVLKNGKISVKTKDEESGRWTVWCYPKVIHISRPKFKGEVIEGNLANKPCSSILKLEPLKFQDRKYITLKNENVKIARYASVFAKKEGTEVLGLPYS